MTNNNNNFDISSFLQMFFSVFSRFRFICCHALDDLYYPCVIVSKLSFCFEADTKLEIRAPLCVFIIIGERIIFSVVVVPVRAIVCLCVCMRAFKCLIMLKE